MDNVMANKWVLDTGATKEESIVHLVNKYFVDNYYYLAGCTDAYCSGRKDLHNFLKEKAERLLELRVFSDEKELYLFRSMVGHDFSWRITSDENLDCRDYIDYNQYIDINTEYSKREDDHMNILSTVGGNYSLPVTEKENMVRIRAYVSYDCNGIGKIVDCRVRGFINEREA